MTTHSRSDMLLFSPATRLCGERNLDSALFSLTDFNESLSAADTHVDSPAAHDSGLMYVHELVRTLDRPVPITALTPTGSKAPSTPQPVAAARARSPSIERILMTAASVAVLVAVAAAVLGG